MSERTISAIMQGNNNRRFHASLSKAGLERHYHQQTLPHPKLWRWVTDHLIAIGNLFESRERKTIKSTCACKKLVYLNTVR